MKLERLVKTYYKEGIYHANQLHEAEQFEYLHDFTEFRGLKTLFVDTLIRRFEVTDTNKPLLEHPRVGEKGWRQKKYENSLIILNINYLISSTISTFHRFSKFQENIHIVHFLLKLTRGRSKYLGKPTKGQRTWSNAKNAKNLSSPIKKWLDLKLPKSTLVEKKDYRKIKKIIKKRTSARRQHHVPKLWITQ